jgi:hypothetical protein
MEDNRETLADLGNEIEDVDTVEIPTVDSRLDIELETCEALGAHAAVTGHVVPAPFSAAMSMLEVIDSPFVTGEPAGMQDLFAALYILHRGEEALAGIYACVRTRRTLERVAGRAFEAGDDAAQGWMANIHATSMGIAEFDRCAMRFGRGLGLIDIKATVAELRDTLHVALGGFRMFPEGDAGDAQKKTDPPSTPRGSRGLRAWFARWRTARRARRGSRCRSRLSGT